MAQNFRRYTSNAVGTSPAAVYTANSYDAIVGISLSNILGTAINVSCYINDGSNNIYLVKDAPYTNGRSFTGFGRRSKIRCSKFRCIIGCQFGYSFFM